MATLAIRGHATRGLEVIGILEALGGKNCKGLNGTETSGFYYIDDSGVIRNSRGAGGVLSITCFSLEEFLKKFPYKVGDKVAVTHPDDSTGILIDEISSMKWNGNEILYGIDDLEFSAEEIQPYKEETMENKPNILQQLKDYFDNTPREVIEKEWHEYDKYNEINPKVNEYLEYVNNIRQPEYPKTYEDCCKVLNIIPNNKLVFSNPNEESEYAYRNLALYNDLDRLKVCRDAYWVLADDWKPDWEDNTYKYVIVNSKNHVAVDFRWNSNTKLSFPTEEMRDAFYTNFKKLIEECKELL